MAMVVTLSPSKPSSMPKAFWVSFWSVGECKDWRRPESSTCRRSIPSQYKSFFALSNKDPHTVAEIKDALRGQSRIIRHRRRARRLKALR